MENIISIASSSMLVELNISAWTARKLDKRVSTEVDNAKGTKTKVVNANKNLLAGTGFLDTITKYASNVRAWNISQTLPWSDNGLRLLPTSNFITYKEHLSKLEENYMALVDKFIEAYPDLVSAAAFQLGDLFDRSEYPSVDKVRDKFKFSYNFIPVPMAGDFRIDINEEAKREIEDLCKKSYEERLNNAMGDAWGRLHKCLSAISERLDYGDLDDKKIFRDSLVDNAMELTCLLKHLNVTNDVELERARLMLESTLKHYDADDLRNNQLARESTKQRVDEILNKFNW